MTTLSPLHYEDLIKKALREDIGLAGDLSTNFFIPKSTCKSARIVSRENGVLAGIDVSLFAFKAMNPRLEITKMVEDGQKIEKGQLIASISGEARSILTAERTALNILNHLSGIASMTSQMVQEISGTKARITDTRKTLPGLRALQKYAVRCGGGINHRFGLDGAVMLKDNHLNAFESWEEGIDLLKEKLGHTIKIEVEVDTLKQLERIIPLPVDIVLLDNMDNVTLTKAVEMVAGKMLTEASGNVRLDTVRAIAKTGVDIISSGALTHSARSLDLGLDFNN